MSQEFLDARDLAERYGVHLNTIANWIQAGKLPEPIRLSRRVIRWRLSTLEAWERAQEKQSTITTKEASRA